MKESLSILETYLADGLLPGWDGDKATSSCRDVAMPTLAIVCLETIPAGCLLRCVGCVPTQDFHSAHMAIIDIDHAAVETVVAGYDASLVPGRVCLAFVLSWVDKASAKTLDHPR